MKTIICDTPTGQYEISLQQVAENRADYYACKVDGYEKGSKEWQEEVNWIMNANYEAIDWLLNNSNFEDWVSIKINNNVRVTDEDFWTSSDNFKIIDSNPKYNPFSHT